MVNLKKLSLGIISLCLLILTQFVAAEGIYRWVDADGNLHYAEQAPDGVKAEKVTPDTSKVGTVQPPMQPTLSEQEKMAEREQQQQAKSEKKFKRKEKKLAEQQACEQATKIINQLEPRPMVLLTDKNGKTYRMPDKQRTDTLQQAKDQQKKYCK